MRLTAILRWKKGVLIGALLTIPAAAANAGGGAFPNDHDDLSLEMPHDASAREILMSIDADKLPEVSFRDHLYLTKKRGLEYRQIINTENQKLFLRFYGPVIKKKPGLGFEFNGLKLGDKELRVRGYGSTKKAGLMFKVTF